MTIEVMIYLIRFNRNRLLFLYMLNGNTVFGRIRTPPLVLRIIQVIKDHGHS